MKDILDLTTSDLLGIVARSHERKPTKSGNFKVTRRTRYHDDMIKRGREERAKARKMETNKMNASNDKIGVNVASGKW